MPVELQAGLRVAFAARVEVGVSQDAGLCRGDTEIVIEERHLAVGRVVVPLQQIAAAVQQRGHVEVGIVEVVVLPFTGAEVIVRPIRIAVPIADRQRVDVVRMPDELVERVRAAVLAFLQQLPLFVVVVMPHFRPILDVPHEPPPQAVVFADDHLVAARFDLHQPVPGVVGQHRGAGGRGCDVRHPRHVPGRVVLRVGPVGAGRRRDAVARVVRVVVVDVDLVHLVVVAGLVEVPGACVRVAVLEE